jgi:hypothetical protein
MKKNKSKKVQKSKPSLDDLKKEGDVHNETLAMAAKSKTPIDGDKDLPR